MPENNDQLQSLQQSILKLEESISRLEEKVRRQTSLRRNFTLSLVKGLGSAVGATVIFALMLASVVQVIRSIDYVPIINNILSSQAIEDVVNRFTQFY